MSLLRSHLRRNLCLGLMLLGVCAAPLPGQSIPAAGRQPKPAKHSAGGESAPLTKEQGDEILNELRLIRQALEDRQPTTAAHGAPPTQPSGKIKMSIAPGAYSIGRDDAPVVVVEFADYQCPFCRQFNNSTFPQLKQAYIDTGKVRFVSRDLPLQFHADAAPAALAARCAGAQGKYWQMRDSLMGDKSDLGTSTIEGYAAKLELNLAAFKACLRDRADSPAIQKDAAEAQRLGISGTPSFVIGPATGDTLEGTRLDGAQPYATFAAAIDSALATAPPPSPPEPSSSTPTRPRSKPESSASAALAGSLLSSPSPRPSNTARGTRR